MQLETKVESSTGHSGEPVQSTKLQKSSGKRRRPTFQNIEAGFDGIADADQHRRAVREFNKAIESSRLPEWMGSWMPYMPISVGQEHDGHVYAKKSGSAERIKVPVKLFRHKRDMGRYIGPLNEQERAAVIGFVVIKQISPHKMVSDFVQRVDNFRKRTRST